MHPRRHQASSSSTHSAIVPFVRPRRPKLSPSPFAKHFFLPVHTTAPAPRLAKSGLPDDDHCEMGESSNSQNTPSRQGRVDSTVTPDLRATPSDPIIERLTFAPVNESAVLQLPQGRYAHDEQARRVSTGTSMAMDTTFRPTDANRVSLDAEFVFHAPIPSLPPIQSSGVPRRRSLPTALPSSSGSLPLDPRNQSDSGSNLSTGTTRSGGKRVSFWKETYFRTIHRDNVACGYECKLCGK